MSIDILSKYASALNVDFSDKIPEMAFGVASEPITNYLKEPEHLKEAKEQISYWKDKYYSLLDKYVELMERQQDKS